MGYAHKIRRIRVDGDTAFVPLTKGYEAVIDAADLPLVERWNWHANVNRNTVYARRVDRTGDKLVNVSMHRLIAGDPAGLEVDHVDGDGLNNRRENLRAVTRTQNVRNQRRARNNTSGVKGVSFDAISKKWTVYIRFNGTRVYLGRFTSLEGAAAAYKRASSVVHGEYGRTA